MIKAYSRIDKYTFEDLINTPFTEVVNCGKDDFGWWIVIADSIPSTVADKAIDMVE